MKVKHLLVGLCTALCGGVFVAPVLATTYSYDVDVQFNFNSKLAVTITDADIKILDLAPGTSADSNIVGITISTNNVAGYTAEATVGNAQNATTNMTHTNGTNTFTSIATDASQASLSTDNTWGYAISTDNGASWSNFSGLPIYTADGKELASTNSPAQDSIKFKINAKAATSQPAGDYTNVINFKVVANVPPKDFTDIISDDYCTNHPGDCDPVTNKFAIQKFDEEYCNAVEVYDSQFQVTDLRDHKNYWISKLQDGNCWMTQNLDLDITSGVALTNTLTDIGWNGSGYDTASWTPNKTTYKLATSEGDQWQQSGPPGSDAFSMDPGDWYEKSDYEPPTSAEACNYPFDSANCTNVISNTADDTKGTHGHIGNYYTWSAAVASNNTYTSSGNIGVTTDSICPTNWRLPAVKDGNNDFSNINRLYNDDSSVTDSKLTQAPVYFVRNGYVLSSHALFGSLETYWSNEDANSGVAYLFFANPGGVQTKYASFHKTAGFAIRCVGRKTNSVTISFDANGGTGTMNDQTIAYGSATTLNANSFTRSGYIFNGWNTAQDGKAIGYGDQDSYLANYDPNLSTTVTLYAQWIEDSGSGGGGGGTAGISLQRAYEIAYINTPGAFDMGGGHTKKGLYYPVGDGTYREATSEADYQRPANELRFAIQDIKLTIDDNGVTKNVCEYATVIGSEAYVLDLRDFKSYYIAKLADGNCWMTQNLDLDLVHVANDNNALYTSENTDIGYGTDHSITKWNPSSSTIPNTNILSNGRINEWCNSNNTPCSVDAGDWYWTDAWYAFNSYTSYNYLAGNQGDKFFRSPTGSGMHGHVGNYYNWTAAIASNSSPSYSSNTYYDPSLSPQNSICPAGWRLPIITSYTEHQLGANDFYNLAYKYGDTLNNDQYYTSSPLWFVRGGLVNLYELDDAGEWSWYASSTVDSGSTSNYALDTTDYVNVVGSNARNIGYSIRCIAR